MGGGILCRHAHSLLFLVSEEFFLMLIILGKSYGKTTEDDMALYAHGMTNCNRILRGDQTTREENLHAGYLHAVVIAAHRLLIIVSCVQNDTQAFHAE